MAVEAKDIQWSKVFFLVHFLICLSFLSPWEILCSPDFQEKSDFVLQRWFSPQVPSKNSCTQNFWFFFVILIPWLGITFCCFCVILMCIQKWFSRKDFVLPWPAVIRKWCWHMICQLKMCVENRLKNYDCPSAEITWCNDNKWYLSII